MAEATFVQDGNAVDYTPGTDVVAGDVVVQGDLVGITRTPIAANALGSLAVAGVFEFAKAAGGGTTITIGTTLYWDDTNNIVTTTASGNALIGKCVRVAGDNDTTVRVRLAQ